MSVNRKFMLFGAILGTLAMASIAAWPLWKWLTVNPVSAALYERTKALVDKDQRLRPAWDKAMEDGVLTGPEAKEILESAGEKAEPE
jgi:hypothetical protein